MVQTLDNPFPQPILGNENPRAPTHAGGNAGPDPADGNPADRAQPQPMPRNSKHRTPELINKFNTLSLKTKLLWNKIKEDNNNRRKALRIQRGDDPDPGSDVSENESVYSISSRALEPLCDQEVYPIFAEVMPDSVKLRVANLKRKRPQHEPARGDPDVPSPSRRRIDGDILKAKDSGESLIKIPDIYFTTEDEDAHIPLPLFHPEVIRYVASNLATIDLTRINPRPGEPKGRTILDIKKLTDRFGDEVDASFSYDKYLESVTHYLSFQTGRDASKDPFTGAGNGKWSTSWFNHFGFFSAQRDTGTLYPFWKHYELELRMAILVDKTTFNIATYDQHFLIARSEAQNEARSRLSNTNLPSSSTPSSSNGPKQFFRPDKKSNRPGKKNTPKGGQHGGHCLGCSKDHTVFQHLSDNHSNFFPDGKPMYCHISDGTLLLPNGREPCFLFNLGSFARRQCGSSCSRTHACTLCGGSHPALSWTCRRCPN